MFIAIEGVDGAGKATQTRLLLENLDKKGFSAESISFPAYGEGSCRFVENFLNGTYGHPSELDGYIASSFYVLDRFEQSPKLKNIIATKDFLVTDRYSISNFIHRGTKFLESNDTEGLHKFFDWIYDFEFNKAGLPKPDLIIFLSLSMKNIRSQIERKKEQDRQYVSIDGGLDLAEQDIKHQEYSLLVGKEYLPKYFHNYIVFECEKENGEMMTPEEINEKLVEIILSKKS
ncbi:MAG: deoxynucleoside kinase [Candidatus Gracilibacteria bacterium]|nr:deoxynucleoside kinase [Candidatus Gracilibacteria bacterium]MDD2909051.1 deoxynucleoside kinase [Candidatus Gracilibacteria bacterium]